MTDGELARLKKLLAEIEEARPQTKTYDPARETLLYLIEEEERARQEAWANFASEQDGES